MNTERDNELTNADLPYVQSLDQETVDKMNRLEFERDFEGLDKLFDEMDLECFNAKYFMWMEEFEKLATPEAGFPADMDMNYSIVDQMFEAGFAPQYAVYSYYHKVSIAV